MLAANNLKTLDGRSRGGGWINRHYSWNRRFWLDGFLTPVHSDSVSRNLEGIWRAMRIIVVDLLAVLDGRRIEKAIIVGSSLREAPPSISPLRIQSIG